MGKTIKKKHTKRRIGKNTRECKYCGNFNKSQSEVFKCRYCGNLNLPKNVEITRGGIDDR